MGKISSPVTDIPIEKTEILVTGPARLLIEILTKEKVVRRDLGNRASPVTPSPNKEALILLELAKLSLLPLIAKAFT